MSTDVNTEIIVYTQPHCASCGQVERYLAARGLSFTVRDVFADAVALEEITSRGYMSTPVTRIGNRWIAGFREAQLERALDGLRR